jgi:fructose/tagatose bisphosphate aldolase
MPVERSQLGWWSPDARGVIPLDALHVSKSLRRSLRRYVVRTDTEAVKHAGLENLVAIVRELAGRTKAPVALHLDHGKSEELARAAVDARYTAVMIDASRESFEENLRETRDIVAYAHARGVHVEAELGTLGGIEDLGEQGCGRC